MDVAAYVARPDRPENLTTRKVLLDEQLCDTNIRLIRRKGPSSSKRRKFDESRVSYLNDRISDYGID